MKKTFLIATTIFCGSLLAQPPDVPANKGAKFGEKISTKGAITSDELMKKLETKNKVSIKVKGEVTEVCAAAGCWLRLKTATSSIKVKMKDHDFFVPTAMVGKTIVIKGIAEVKTTSVDELQHYAEDAGKTKEEIEAIKEPKKEVILIAAGIVVEK